MTSRSTLGNRKYWSAAPRELEDPMLRVGVRMSMSDCGPDQLLLQKTSAAEVMGDDLVFHFSLYCLMHQAHMAVKKELVRADVFLKNMRRPWKGFPR